VQAGGAHEQRLFGQIAPGVTHLCSFHSGVAAPAAPPPVLPELCLEILCQCGCGDHELLLVDLDGEPVGPEQVGDSGGVVPGEGGRPLRLAEGRGVLLRSIAGRRR